MNKIITKLCWICGNPANSKEHKSQKADLKAVLGIPNQREPLFLNSATQRNKQIGSLKSDLLKSEAGLCQKCNNERTQPHDLAWHEVNRVLRTRTPKISGGQIIPCNKIISYNTAEQMLNIHLFFCKKFGCHIDAENIDSIDIKPFAEAILQSKPHPNVYLAFGPSNSGLPFESIENTNLMLEKKHDGKCAFAVWGYISGDVAVHVMYAAPGEDRRGLVNSWHPLSNDRKHLHLTDFFANEDDEADKKPSK